MPDKIKEKKCSKCHIIKSVDNFNKLNKSKDGLKSACKSCRKKYRDSNKKATTERGIEHYSKNKELYKRRSMDFYNNNKEYVSERSKKYRQKNVDKLKKISKKYRDNKLNKEHAKVYIKEYFKINKEKINIQKNIYNAKNKDKRNKYLRDKRKNDIQYKLRNNLRCRFNLAIKKGLKQTSVINLTGCSIEELKRHVESQFQEGMSWDNWSRKGWHIDHIKPCASFDLTDLKQQKQCFHYTNLQPLWAIDNLEKSNKYKELTNEHY